MNPKRFALVLACAFALHAPHASAARAQETAAVVRADKERPLAEMLRAVEGEGKKDAEAWFRLGVAQDAAGDREGALKSFRQALKLRPGFDLARAGAAHVLYEQGKLNEAEKEAMKSSIRAGTVESRNVVISVLFAVRLARQSNAAAAELAKAERELAKKPGDPRWHLRKALALLGTSTTPARPRPFRLYFEDRRALGPAPATAPPDEAVRRASRESTRKRYGEAAASFEKYLSLKPDAEDRGFVLGQLEALRFYMNEGDARTGEKFFASSELTTKAVILSKPDPGYTEEARKNDVSGVVRLRAVLAADGTIKYILAVKTLPHGLTERAFAAARRLTFRPAQKDGRPVSQYVTLEYHFNIY